MLEDDLVLSLMVEEDREVVVIESVVEYSLGPCIHGERCAGCPLVAVVVEVRRLLEPVEPTVDLAVDGGECRFPSFRYMLRQCPKDILFLVPLLQVWYSSRGKQIS